ncbi:RNase A-like domain-containing protein [Kitasatospora griseola]|uniref:RNase A-like domain-containing protein n=1 Tax=Kitasatospora griseola TaxID=2064 RepID=UPI0036DECB51
MAVGGLLAGLLATPAFAAGGAEPPIGPIPDRVAAIKAWKDGGLAVKRAAETALAGSDGDVAAFLASGRTAASEADVRASVEGIVATSGPWVRDAAQKALAGTAADVKAFVDSGYKRPFEDDQRLRLSQIMSSGGPAVRKAAGLALDGTIDDVNTFLTTGQYRAQDDDDRLKLSQLMSSGSTEVRKAAGLALDGTIEDVREFLRYGYQTAAAHDQETLTIAQLADLTANAVDQAGQQAREAEDAAAKALAASALAKQAAEKAAAETKAAKGDAQKASNAAAKAADAAERAAKAAKQASSAAAKANEASRQAADAAADAARASAAAGNASAQAQDFAAKAAGNAADADKAKNAAVNAKKLAGEAQTIGERAQWAEHASKQADKAAQAANEAATNSDAAAAAATEAANQAGVSEEARDRARAAADRAHAAAAEAHRACAAVQKIAAEARAAAAEARRAADSAAAHAGAASDAAQQAADHAGDAALAAATAQAAATAAQQAADDAASAATQAHKIADLARASDAERLAAQQAAEVAVAEQAYFDEAAKAKQAAWETGKATELAADTQRLLNEATAVGVDPSVAVAKGRLAATRLLTAGGPWVQVAAQTALEGHDADVLAFLSTDLALARERDDRTSVAALASASTKLERRLAAETASVGTVDEVRAFLATGAYPGKDDDDRLALSKIMSSGGPRVREAAGKALDGTIADVRAFLATGQYAARDDDNRLLVSQAISGGGPEVQAAAQAAMSGPTSGLEPFLKIGLPKAQQRDAVTAAHVTTIASYLQDVDGNVAQARQYAAQAAQSYANARGASDEANAYAGQAQASANEAANWAAQAAESARQAKASADRAATYAAQARASAADADAAARNADYSASAAAASAALARQYATDAKDAADRALASKLEAQASAAEARQAAIDAANIVYQKMKDGNAAGEMESQTAVVDDLGRVSYMDAVPHGELKQEIVFDGKYGKGLQACVDAADILSSWRSSASWHRGPNGGEEVCTFPVNVKVTGEIDYILRTCPEAGLSIAACHGKYNNDWVTTSLYTKQLDHVQMESTYDLPSSQYMERFKCYSNPGSGSGMCQTMESSKIVVHLLVGDFIECFKNPGLNASCAWAASNFIPYATLGKAAKGLVAFRFALETGTDLGQARLALQASLDGFKDATVGKLLASADALSKFRLNLKSGMSADEALTALRNVRDMDPQLLRQAENEAAAVKWGEACETNSFPAGTPVLLADGSHRPIEQIRIGDSVLTSAPDGQLQAQTVTATYSHLTGRLTEVSLEGGGILTSTEGHRVYVEGGGWKTVADLRPGDRVRSADGSIRSITALRPRTAQDVTVYDLTVDGTHTFFAGTAGTDALDILVHNCVNFIEDDVKFADEGGHTVSDHIDLSGQKLLDAVKAKGLVTVWADAATAQKAVAHAVTEWRKVPANERALQNWIKAQRKRIGDNIGFDPRHDLQEVPWEIPIDVIQGDLAYKYELSGKPLPANPLTKTATGRKVLIQLKYVAKHPDNFIVYTSYPE